MDTHKDQFPLEQQPFAIDQALLTSVVRQMVGSEAVEIIDHPHQHKIEDGAVGTVIRLTGIGRTQSKLVLWSVILKFVPAPGSDITKFIATSEDSTAFNYWRRELLLYSSDFFSNLPDGFAAPRCFHIDVQPDGYWLWLEEIKDKLGRPWPLVQYGIAARHLGYFNGQYLVKHEIPAFSWLASHQQHARSSEKRMLESKIWSQLPGLCEQHAIMHRGWPNRLLEDFHRLWLEREQFFQVLQTLPKILKHGDAGHRNLFARQREDGTVETVAIDWAYAGIGSVGEDLTQLVASTALWFGMSPTLLPELDQVAFEGYLQGLHDAGWRGNPKIVRLGYMAYTALHYGLSLTRPLELTALDEQKRFQTEKMFGHSIEEIVDNTAAVRHFVITCADEARKLMDSLPKYP